MVKSSTTTAITSVGQQVPYEFLVTNTGNVTLTGVTVTDTLTPPASPANLGPITCGPTNVPNGSVTLGNGGTVTCRATYTVSEADYSGSAVTNVATATGTPPSGPAPVSPGSTVSIPVDPDPALSLAKSADPSTVNRAGDQVVYRYDVTNIGNVALTAITVDETAFSGTGTPGPIDCGSPDLPLAPGGERECVGTYTVTQADIDAGQITNTAVALGTPPTIPGQPPPDPVQSAPSSAIVTATGDASLTVVKSSGTKVIWKPGQQVPYTFLVTNTGSVRLTNVTVTDRLVAPADSANLGPITCGLTGVPNGSVTLAAGDSITCRATYTVSWEDYRHGSVRDVATVTGTPPSGPAPVSPESTLTIPVKAKHHLPVTGPAAGRWITIGLTSVLLGTALVLAGVRRRVRT
ncbi:DUF11 domain-containing protein [Micromonospora sp. NBC_01699]|nr:hypothetical protein [Micromonospora sp. NBC_01699]